MTGAFDDWKVRTRCFPCEEKYANRFRAGIINLTISRNCVLTEFFYLILLRIGVKQMYQSIDKYRSRSLNAPKYASTFARMLLQTELTWRVLFKEVYF